MILTQAEGGRLEFKSKLSENSDLAKTIIAFANDADSELYIDIRDKSREIVGILQQELGQELQEKRQQYLVRGQELKEPTMFSQILKQLISPKSRQDLVIAFGLKKVYGYVNRTLKRLFVHKLIEHTIPDTPNHPAQKFKLTERGGELFLLLLRNKEQQY